MPPDLKRLRQKRCSHQFGASSRVYGPDADDACVKRLENMLDV